MKNQPQELQLIKTEPMPVTRPQSFDIEGMFRYAIDRQGSAETIERLMNVRRELNAEASKKAFDEALSAFQSKCTPIMKEKGVPTRSGKTAYKYAPIEAIEVQIRPLLREYGFYHTFDTDTASDQGWVIAKCIVTHKDGHSRISTSKFPLGTKTDVMSDTQVFAAALTFANRRALCNAYGLVLVGEDLDGATGKLKPAGPSTKQPDDLSLKEIAQQLWDVLKPVRGNLQNWDAANQWLWREEILDGAVPETAPHLSVVRFKETITKAKEVLSRD
jgi:hypothetical protein